jgi:flagellar hook-basal body complex protein FliE
MKTGAIDHSRIEAMVTQLRARVQEIGSAPGASVVSLGQVGATKVAGAANFADALKLSIDKVNAQQRQAETLSEQFALGDDSVNLSDVMIERQKASIALQATVQVRNKLVAAYHDMMNMQV